MPSDDYISRPEILRRDLWSPYLRPEIHVGAPDVPGCRGRPSRWLLTRVEAVERVWRHQERLVADSTKYVSHRELVKVRKWGARRLIKLGAPDIRLEHRQGRPAYYLRTRIERPLTPMELVDEAIPRLVVQPGRYMPPARNWRVKSDFTWEIIFDDLEDFARVTDALYPAVSGAEAEAHRRLREAALAEVWRVYPQLRW